MRLPNVAISRPEMGPDCVAKVTSNLSLVKA